MNEPSLLSKLRQQRRAKRPKRQKVPHHRDSAQAQSAPSGAWKLPAWQRWTAVIALSALLLGGSAWAYLYYVAWNQIPAALAGKWEVVEPAAMRGGTFEFFRDGRLEIYHAATGSLMRAQVSLADRTLSTTTRDTLTGLQDTKYSTIRELTDTNLILELERGNVLKMVRRTGKKD